MDNAFPFASTARPTIDQVGGKALGLIARTGEGMPVPPGFVLSVEFFAPWIDALRATPEWAALQQAGEETLAQSTAALRALCGDLRFTTEQQEELDRAVGSLREVCPETLFAVRSSSPEEDLESASFAGAYTTTLGVTEQDLAAAIRECFASVFHERVILYKREHGLPTDRPRIAVIVQRQIDADSAGVAFSLNPLNNCYDEAVINANTGLGESVVAGEVDPDTFVVDKVKRQIIDARIGAKEVSITLDGGGGTSRASREPGGEACITPAQVLGITKLLARVEARCDTPVDIEWAIAGQVLYLLQSRPITTYLPLPVEMITAPGEPKRLYADSTLIEQGIEEPLSVLGTDFLGYVFRVMSGPMGRVTAGVDGIAFTAGGKYYMNLSNSIRVMGRNASLAPGSQGDATVLGILDTIDLDQYLERELPDGLKSARRMGALSMLPYLLQVMLAFLRPEAFMRKYLDALPGHLKRFAQAPDPCLSLVQQAIDLTGLLRFWLLDYAMPMVFASQLAMSRIQRLFEEDGDRAKEHLLNLGTSLPGNKTAEMGARMSELASSDFIRAHASAQEFVARLEDRSLDPAFLRTWDRYIDEFGFRCPREVDVATPRPSEEPGNLFEQLKNISTAQAGREGKGTVFEEARAKREEAYETLHEFALRRGRRTARTLDKLYRTWVTLGGYRETGKHYAIMAVGRFRKRVLEVASGLVEEGRLDCVEQIFDLTVEDIDRASTDSSLDLRSLAAERTAPMEQIRRSHRIARVIDSRGRIYAPPHREGAEGELVGVPISAGVAEGRVKVLHHAAEKPLLPGEILVARATDPGWTPLFIHAAGIILEIGGVLQHGAVVAREYGIPCVSGLTGATDLLRDGQIVAVDGTHGVVRILRCAR